MQNASVGRATKSSEELSEFSKRQKTMGLRREVSTKELAYAVGTSQHTSGNTDASVMIEEIIASPIRATKMHKLIISNQEAMNVRIPQRRHCLFPLKQILQTDSGKQQTNKNLSTFHKEMANTHSF